MQQKVLYRSLGGYDGFSDLLYTVRQKNRTFVRFAIT